MKTSRTRRLSWLLTLVALLAGLSSIVIVAADSIQWKQIGPGGGGNIRAVAVSPANPNIALMGSDVGGIFRTADGGTTWSLRNTANANPSRFSSYGFYEHFGFDPTNANIVYYGPMKSTDAGLTWNIKIDESALTSAGGVVDSANHNVVYTYAYSNIYRSSDGWESTSCTGASGGGTVCSPGGSTCGPKSKCYQQSCLPSPGTGSTSGDTCFNYIHYTHSLVINPDDHTKLLACNDSGLYQSTDTAKHWTQITSLPGVGGLCVGGSAAGNVCYGDADCPSGACKTGTCSGTCTGGTANGATCQINADCPGGTCTTGVSTESACNLNADCGGSLTCVGAPCVNLVIDSPSKTLFMLVESKPSEPFPPGWVNIDSWRGGLYKSTDWGTTWTNINGSDGTNVLSNAGFETAGDANHPAANWLPENGTPVRDCTVSHSGSCSIKIDYSHQGDIAPGVNTDPMISIQGGQLYKISGWYKATSATGIIASGVLQYFQDSLGTQPVHLPGLPTIFWVEPYYYGTDPTFDWRRFEALVRPPDAVAYARISFRAAYGSGTIYIDDVSFKPVHSLPKISGQGQSPHFVSYSDVVVDPTNLNTLYVGTLRGTYLDYPPNDDDVGGVWKTTDGGTNWTHVTRSFWHDNVQDNGTTEPVCGDNVCGGRWENCNTCPGDCTGSGKPATPPGCCGDGTCYVGPDPNNPVESYDNCRADCPFDKDTNTRPYYEIGSFISLNQDQSPQYTYGAPRGNGRNEVWSMGIGSGTTGHNTLYVGAEHLKTTDGGNTWTEVSSDLYQGADSDAGTLQARGETNDVATLDVVTDTRSGLNRLYYGDVDNRLQVSYNGGKSFGWEGWQWNYYTDDPNFPLKVLVGTDGASSIVLDKDYPGHTGDPNHIYVGAADSGADFQGLDQTSPCCHGTLQASYTAGTPPAVGKWTWSTLGNQNLPGGPGGIELVQTSTGDFLAAVYGKGIFKHVGNGTTGDWTCLGGDANVFAGCSSVNANWSPVPGCGNDSPSAVCWKAYRILQEPSSGRFYASFGNPANPSGPAVNSGESGVWESNNGGTNWCRISNTSSDPLIPYSMDKEPVTDIVSLGPNNMLVSTFYGSASATTDSSGSWTGDGGLYRGTRTADCTWSWTRVLAQPNVTGIEVSPFDNSLQLAFVGQVCCSGGLAGVCTTGPLSGHTCYTDGDCGGGVCGTPQKAGIYKSFDGGQSWASLTGSTPMNLSHGHLYPHSSNQLKVYASTIADGVFEGTVSCTDATKGFDCSTRLNPSVQLVSTGVLLNGTVTDLAAGGPDDTYVAIQEATALSRLSVIWTVPGGTTGVAYTLVLEGSKNSNASPANDPYTFSYARTSGSCTGGESYTTTPMTVNKTSDDDRVQTASLPALSGGNTTYCIKLADTTANDTQHDTVTLDRLYLVPSPADVVSVGDHLTGPGRIFQGSFTDTQVSDDVREVLQEDLVGNTSSLTHIWRFDVPPGTSHTIHLEGYRPANPDGDNFQFSYSTDGTNYTNFATFSSPAELQGGVDYPVSNGRAGVWYVRVQDTNSANGKTSLDKVYVDHLSIKTVP